jgi:hypothetical protein
VRDDGLPIVEAREVLSRFEISAVRLDEGAGASHAWAVSMSQNWKLFWWDVRLAALGGMVAGTTMTFVLPDLLTFGSLWLWPLGFAVGSAFLQSFFRFKKRGPDA